MITFWCVIHWFYDFHMEIQSSNRLFNFSTFRNNAVCQKVIATSAKKTYNFMCDIVFWDKRPNVIKFGNVPCPGWPIVLQFAHLPSPSRLDIAATRVYNWTSQIRWGYVSKICNIKTLALRWKNWNKNIISIDPNKWYTSTSMFSIDLKFVSNITSSHINISCI